jgi:hypothetical protein
MGIETAILGALAGAGALTGGLANKKKTTTSTQSTTPQLSPELQPLQNTVQQNLMQRLLNPQGVPDATNTAAVSGVNRAFKGSNDRITEALSQRGFGNSGVAQTAIAQNEAARAGKLGGLESIFAQMGQDQENNTLNLAERLLSQGRGVSSTSEGTTPGNVAGGALTGGLQGLMYALLSGQGGFGGGGGYRSPGTNMWGGG